MLRSSRIAPENLPLEGGAKSVKGKLEAANIVGF
jgi:hypothetical protein